MTGCQKCGRRTTNTRLCPDCSREDYHERRERDIDWGVCPQCGGPSGSDDVRCADCRRGDGDD